VAYTLIEATLGVSPAEVLFVSSNPFDVCGAKSFGLNVAWIERITPAALANELAERDRIAPLTMFKLLRTQLEELGFAPDHRIRTLSELPAIVAA
jgi:2-haloacid dehalogenase